MIGKPYYEPEKCIIYIDKKLQEIEFKTLQYLAMVIHHQINCNKNISSYHGLII